MMGGHTPLSKDMSGQETLSYTKDRKTLSYVPRHVHDRKTLSSVYLSGGLELAAQKTLSSVPRYVQDR